MYKQKIYYKNIATIGKNFSDDLVLQKNRLANSINANIP